MANCLAPGYIKLFYTSNGHTHVQTIPVKPASVAPNFDLTKKGGGTVDQNTAIVGLIAVMAPFFYTADSFTGWEAYTQADCAHAPVFQNNGTIVGVSGTNTHIDYPWVQMLMTFKSVGGGRARFQMMEGATAQDIKIDLAGTTDAALVALRDYITGASSWLTARDNTFINVPIRFITKLNDELRKKYLNP
jgi:hypothetical protein